MAGPSSIIGAEAIRFSRTLADGTPDFGNPSGSFLLCGGISTFQHDYEIAEGADIYEEDAGGNACVVKKRPSRVKRVTFTLTMCRSDYRVDEIVGVAAPVLDGDVVIGRAVKSLTGCGGQVLSNGVIIELWSEQQDCDTPLEGAPFMRTVIGQAFLVPKGFSRESGVSKPVYEGYGIVNPNFGDGPFGDLDDVETSVTDPWVLVDVDDDALPTCVLPVDYVALPAGAS